MRTQALGAVATVAAATLTATACGNQPISTGAETTTMTVTPTVTAKPPKQAATSTSAGALHSDDRGRHFDLGAVTAVDQDHGHPVLVLDRWTDPKVPDAKLAQQGIPIAPYRGAPFKNVNTKLTYRIPVTANATLLEHHCLAPGEPLQTKSVSAADLASLEKRDRVVVVMLDERGYATKVENLPGC